VSVNRDWWTAPDNTTLLDWLGRHGDKLRLLRLLLPAAAAGWLVGETTDLVESRSDVEVVVVETEVVVVETEVVTVEVPGPVVTVPAAVEVVEVEVPGPVVTVPDVRVEVVETEVVVTVLDPFPVPQIAVQTELVEIPVVVVETEIVEVPVHHHHYDYDD